MSDRPTTSPNRLVCAYHAGRELVQRMSRRLMRAWRYATGTTSPLDAQAFFYESVHLTGWYPMMLLTEDEVFEQARADYEYHPALRGLIATACLDVACSWQDDPTLTQARSRAIRRALLAAQEAGIVLHRRPDRAETTAES